MVTGPAEGNVNWWGSMWWDTTAKLSTWALVINVLISRCKHQEEEWGGLLCVSKLLPSLSHVERTILVGKLLFLYFSPFLCVHSPAFSLETLETLSGEDGLSSTVFTTKLELYFSGLTHELCHRYIIMVDCDKRCRSVPWFLSAGDEKRAL